MSRRSWESTFVVVPLVTFALLFAGCSGGGGGSAPPPPPSMAQLLQYSVSPPDPGSPLLNAAFNGNLVTFTDFQVSGTYHRTTHDATMSAGSTLTADTGGLHGNLNIEILTKTEWSQGGDPTSGSMRVTWDGGAVELTTNPDVNGSGQPGVDLALYQSGDLVPPVVSMTWPEFHALEDEAAAPEYQQVANFAYGGWQFFFRQVLVGYTAIMGVIDSKDEFVASGGAPVPIVGAEFPPGSTQHGQILLQWMDTSGDSAPGAGDNFSAPFTTWWVDDPGDNYDNLYQGMLDLNSFVQSSTPQTRGADCVFHSFEERETDSNFVITPDLTTVSGGYHLEFHW